MIPYSEIETVFLDAGNTLVSIDFPWIAEELATLGIDCQPDALRRAEAAARPRVSRQLAESGDDGRVDFSFALYLAGILERLEVQGTALQGRRETLVDELAPILHGPGRTARLWSWVIPGVPEALEGISALGRKLLVVSNSDGTAAQSLREQGLDSHIHTIVDSHHVGFEKPDPRIFRHALEVAGATPERTLHVGDLYSADVLGAREAGLHALLLDPFGDWCDVDCPTLPDLTALQAALTKSARVGAG
jgi:FMN phosphatase YigB (HAD superfamily)